VAENDKFEYGLPKYWSKAHRLACASAPIPSLVDEIVTGARLTLRGEANCRAICRLADLLEELRPVDVIAGQTQIFEDWDYRHAFLEVQLEQLTEAHEQYPCMRIIAQAARAVFEKLNAAGAGAENDVQDLLAEEITTRIIDHRWLSRGRARLQQQSGRGMDQQFDWEAELLAILKPQARRLFKTIYREERVAARSPARLTHRVPLTLEKLHAPIVGITGGDSDD
jgi:hypothetical protein